MKILIIRFSSLGDIFQCMEVPRSIKTKYPQAEIHWITKAEFADLVETNPFIDKVWSFNRNKGFNGLKYYVKILNQENYDLIYDAHNNLRSHLLKIPLMILGHARIITRPKNRIKRFLFFKLKMRKLLPSPFRGMESFLRPLKPLRIRQQSAEAHPLDLPVPKSLEKYNNLAQTICLAPGAAHKLKKWPLDYWQKLVLKYPDKHFLIVGGPLDSFCKEISNIAPKRCHSLAGKLTWVETIWLISQCQLTIAGDTGALHVADFLGRDCIGLFGPSAFGFTSRPNSKAISKKLKCQPCSKDGSGRCTNKVYQKCLYQLTPETVSKTIDKIQQSHV